MVSPYPNPESIEQRRPNRPIYSPGVVTSLLPVLNVAAYKGEISLDWKAMFSILLKSLKLASNYVNDLKAVTR